MADAVIGIFQRFSWIILVFILIIGWYSPVLMLLTFVCMIAPVFFSFKYGRAWCGNFCPRSSLNNHILKLVGRERTIPLLFCRPWFRLLIFVLLMLLFALNLAQSGGTWKGIGYAFLRMMVFTTVIEICLGIFLQRNAWCMICPMGSLSALVTRIRGYSNAAIKAVEGCTKCNACSRNCPIRIPVPEAMRNGRLTASDCMKCRNCIKACPHGILYWEMK